MMHRPVVLLAKAFVFLLAFQWAGHAAAQASDYPSRPIRMIIPYAPGGPDDLIGRIVGKKLNELWGQPVVIDNRPGVGGIIAIDVTSKSVPDGYTLAVGDLGQLAIAPGLYVKLPYHPLRDLAPVAKVASFPYALAVHPGVPARTVRELIELAKSKKVPMTYGSTGTGGTTDLAMRLFSSLTGVELLQVPYKGSGPFVTALLAGEVDMAITDMAVGGPQAKAGKLRLLAAASDRRLVLAPQLPTIAEAGVEGYSIEFWGGIVAPVGTPRDIINKLSSAIDSGLKAPDVQQRFNEIGYAPVGGTPEQFVATIRADIEKYARIIKNANIKPQ
ncbi:MAG: tripartite tricarboxylate transporter substrate binding protein [Betaproteobacteria bacterium]|nr:tripartite tricarboxylate transporter substrate binding protein [Betaproteobacteria bacterium]